jgi:hypothetical protein
MAALTGLLIADSYKALLKTVDNDVLGATAKEIVDGYGNVSGVLFDTSGNVTINGNFRALDAILDSSGNPGTAGQVLTTTGTTTQWQSLSSVSGVTGSGTAGYLPLWSTTSALTNSIVTQSGATISVGGTLNVNTRVNTPILQITGGIGTQGTMSWNADEETVDLIQNGSILPLGQRLEIHVKNQTGATIPKGSAVRAAGTLGASGRILIAPMIADGSIEAKYFLGITNETIQKGEDGKVITFGKIDSLNTAAYAEGQTLWVSATTAGAFVTTRPVAPNLDLEVAIVINSSVNNGTIFVRSNIGHYLGTAHDVNITSVAENDLLVYKTNRWVNTKSIGDLSAANVTLSGYLRGPATFVIDPAAYGDETGLVQILGDLRVDGTTTTINSTTISVSDKNITLAKDAATAGDANGAGLTIGGANATLTYLSATDDFTFNKNVNASRFVGPLTGDVTGTISTLSNHDTDDLAEGLANLYFTTARARAAFSAGTGVSIASGVISIGQSVGTTDDVTFGVVTASLSGNATTASALANARNIALDGSVTGNADFDGSGNITITTTTNHNHDDRYYTETESDAKYLLNTTDTLDGDLTVTGDLIVTGGIDLSNADLDIGSADIIFGTTAGGATRGLIWDVSGSGFLSKLIGGGADGGKVTLFANMDDAITTGNIFEIKDGSTGSLFLGLSHAGILTAGGGTSTQWNTAYTYSQVGHLPLTGGTLSGALTSGRLTLTNNVSTGGFGSFNDYQILLYKDTTADSSYGVGIENNTFMFHSNDQYKFYVNNAVKATINGSGNLTLTGTITASGYNKTNWDTAYGWGNHAGLYLPLAGKAADSELLDGLNSTAFIRNSGYANQTEYSILDNGSINGPVIKIRYDSGTVNRWWDIGYKDGNGTYYEGLKGYNNSTLTWVGQTVIHSGNIGSQSVANASTLDSIDSSQFLRSDESDTMTGSLAINASGVGLNVSSSQNTGLIVDGGTNSGIIAEFKNSTTKAVINTSGGGYFLGDVGIGTTSTAARLEISGTASTTSTDTSLFIKGGNSGGNYNNNQILFGYANTRDYAHAIKTRHQAGSVAGNAFDFYTWKYGDAAGTTAGQHVMTIQGNGVGIGTTSPDVNLQIQANQAPTIRFNGTDASGGAGSVQFYNQGTQKFNLTTLANSNDLALYNNGGTNSFNFFVRHSDGNVGIGTTSPSEKLEVNGTIASIAASDPTFKDIGRAQV